MVVFVNLGDRKTFVFGMALYERDDKNWKPLKFKLIWTVHARASDIVWLGTSCRSSAMQYFQF